MEPWNNGRTFDGYCTNGRGLCDTEPLSTVEIERLLIDCTQTLCNVWHRYEPELASDSGLWKRDNWYPAKVSWQATDWAARSVSNYSFIVKWLYRLHHHYQEREGVKHRASALLPLLLLVPEAFYSAPEIGGEVTAKIRIKDGTLTGKAIASNQETAGKIPLSIISWNMCSNCRFHQRIPETRSTKITKVHTIYAEAD